MSVPRILATAVAVAGLVAVHGGAQLVATADGNLSPATAVTVDPTLSVSPAFSVGRLCLPGSTCP